MTEKQKRKRKKLTPKVIETLAKNLRNISNYSAVDWKNFNSLSAQQKKRYQPWFNHNLSDEIVKVRPNLEHRSLAEENVRLCNRKHQLMQSLNGANPEINENTMNKLEKDISKNDLIQLRLNEQE
jgi:hypothetical protein